MIEDFPISDSLHLIDLGVMKRLLRGWRDGDFGKLLTKWRARDTQIVTDFLKLCKLPTEIHRSVRGLDELHFWKATEFRTFLHYLSVVILPDVLPIEAFEHFLLFFCAVTICSTKNHFLLLDLSQAMFLQFVDTFKKFYGDYVTSNIHNLCHVTDEVKKFGPLNTFNSYPFENKLYTIKKMLRDGNKPLAQIANRLQENLSYFQNMTHETKTEVTFPKLLVIRGKTCLDYGLFVISQKCQDKYFMTFEHDIIEFKEIVNKKILGYKIDNITDIFVKPIKSSLLKMYKSSIPRDNRNTIAIDFSDVQFKFAGTTYNNTLYLIPLLHTLCR